MGKHKKWALKWISLLLCLSLIVVSSSVYAADEETESGSDSKISSSDQDKIDDLQNQLEDLQQQQEDIQEDIDNAKSEREKKLAEKQQLDNQISLIQQEISVLTEKIDTLENSISTTEEKISNTEEKIFNTQEKIEQKQQDIDENFELFKQRLRAMYMRGDASSLGLILGADSFYDFLTKSEVIKRITDQDKELIDVLKSDKQSLEQDKQSLEQDKQSLEQDKQSLDIAKQEIESDKQQLSSKQQELDSKVAQTEKEIDYISQLEEQYLANQQAIKKQMDAANAEITQIIQNAQNSGSGQGSEFVGGEFLWPLPGFSNITSYYGWRFGGTDFHTGIDISGGGVYGAPIVAANDGTVIKANYNYVDGVGYGMYVIIDHGGGYSTLYAHTSGIAVSEGQKVSRGDTIAYVGSTGWSTGAHLHFEVRVNGSDTNPLPYLQ